MVLLLLTDKSKTRTEFSFIIAQAIKANGFVYTSGQVAINPATGKKEGYFNAKHHAESFMFVYICNRQSS